MKSLSLIAERWAVVEQLLDQMLELPAAERQAWLESLSGDHAQHRDALRALLQTQASVETNDFLGEGPRLGGGLAGARASAEPHRDDRVGNYRLIRELGRGGMGLVWLAERADAMAARQVALKLPRIAWGDSFAERLARERDILATLEHAHIARLYDAGIDGHGRPFIAMQFVEGEPIDAYCRHHGLPVRERIGLLLQAMSAVAHAHARLVVHRDIKPGNILVGADGQATLLDFGIAKLIDDGQPTRATALTESSGRALTPDYASPEQIRGEPLGTASDVYSLGVVAFELLSGARPYRLGRGTSAELERAILEVTPPLASERAADPALRKTLRGDLDAILNRSLKKAVAERYPSVEAFAQDLRRHLQGEPVQARPDSARYRLGKFVGRHRLATAMGSALTLSVLAGSAASVWQAQQARAQERRAGSEVRRQLAVQDLYSETLSRLSVLAVENPEMLSRPGGVTSVLQAQLREMAPRFLQPDERGAQLGAVMLQLNSDNRFEDALAVGREYLAYQKAHAAPAAQVIRTYSTLGRTLFQLKRYEECEAIRRAGMNWAPAEQDREAEAARLEIASDLGSGLTTLGRRDEALKVLSRADAMAAQHFAGEPLRIHPLVKLGVFLLGFDDARALQVLQQAQAEHPADKLLDPDDAAHLGWQFGEALLANGQAAEAESALNASLAMFRTEFGRDNPSAVRAFGRAVSATARVDTTRASALIEAERQLLAERPGGLSRRAEWQLLARQFEVLWLAGDAPAAARVALPDDGQLLAPAALRDTDLLQIGVARALLMGGRAPQAQRLMASLLANGPGGRVATLGWLRTSQALAEVQLATGQFAAAGQTAADLLLMLEQAHATQGSAYRAALTTAALAAARAGDRAAASALLARIEQQPMPPFPSAAERADCELRRAQALRESGRNDEAAGIARGLLAGLATQHPQSPRLAQARQLAGTGS
jgi:serine/threonine-protein kinase